MSKIIFSRNSTRRDCLKAAAVAGMIAAGGYLLYEYAPWLDYEEEVGHLRRPFGEAPVGSAEMRELVRYATLAANGHNTQPWKFTIKHNNIEIHPDYERRLPVVDPNDRELWISLGCALENLLIAARAVGYVPEVTYPEEADLIHVRLEPDVPQSSPLFDAIPLRQSTRSEYDGQLIEAAELNQVQAVPLEPGIVLHFAANPTALETVFEYIHQGTLSQFADQAFVDELIHWLRFSQKEALASLDGLFTRSLGNPEVPRWLGQIFVAGTNPQQQADADVKKLRSSPGAVVVASLSEDKCAWVRTGQVYERMALTMTSLNIKSALLNQPIEVADLRLQFQRAMGLGASVPQLLVRFGYTQAMPHSLRRPVEKVLVPSWPGTSQPPH